MKVLLPVDGSPYSNKAVRTVAERPWPAQSIVRVLAVVEFVTPPIGEVVYTGGDMEGARQEVQKLAARTAASLENMGLTIETAVREGDPRSVIVEEAEQWNAELIVMGTHGYTGLKRLLLGSVAQAVVAHAPCSVEVVRKRENCVDSQ